MPLSLASLAMSPSPKASNKGGRRGRIWAPLNRGRNQFHQLASSRAAASESKTPGRRTSTAALDGCRTGQGGHDRQWSATRAQVRMREAAPVEIHMEDTKAAKADQDVTMAEGYSIVHWTFINLMDLRCESYPANHSIARYQF